MNAGHNVAAAHHPLNIIGPSAMLRFTRLPALETLLEVFLSCHHCEGGQKQSEHGQVKNVCRQVTSLSSKKWKGIAGDLQQPSGRENR